MPQIKRMLSYKLVLCTSVNSKNSAIPFLSLTDVTLFITAKKPYTSASADTISRWQTRLLHEAGIDTRFRASSIRSAASTKVLDAGLPINIILGSANWTNETTFKRHYYISSLFEL